MKQTKYFCDIEWCDDEINGDHDEHLDKHIQVIFTTEQTEGKSVNPYTILIEKTHLFRGGMNQSSTDNLTGTRVVVAETLMVAKAKTKISFWNKWVSTLRMVVM